MRALLIGGTGTISSAITRLLVEKGWEVTLINRGHRNDELPQGVELLVADMNNEDEVRELLEGRHFDTVAEFIAFVPEQVERDIRLFTDMTDQYIFISSASAYAKPNRDYRITEGTTLANPYWQYSRNKIACERVLMDAYRNDGFPVTIVRPSHTYDERNVPIGVDGSQGSWQVLQRMKQGKPVIVQGDGTSLWTVTFNKDFAVGFVGLMGNIHALGEAVHITSDESLSWNQIYEAVGRALGVTPLLYHVSSEFLASVAPYDYQGSLIGDKAVSVVFDNAKIKRLVPEFKCTTRFDEGARICVDYMMSHPQCQKEDPEFDAWCDRVIASLEAAKKAVQSH